MERLRRISEFWNWLPAFRAVAETQHVRTAADQLRVSPSALSRSIGLLEESLGCELFDREGRGIKLNANGHAFLNALRAAMRLVDDGLRAIESTAFVGTVHVAAPDEITFALWRGVQILQAEHPDLTVHFHSAPTTELNMMLSQGQLDLAFSETAVPDANIEVESFSESASNIYCSDSHPLAAQKRVTVQDVLSHPFAARVDTTGLPTDRWPVDVSRNVGVYVHRIQSAIEATLFGGMLSVLPDYVAADYERRSLMVRLDVDLIPDCTFYALRRRQLVEEDANAAILEIFRQGMG